MTGLVPLWMLYCHEKQLMNSKGGKQGGFKTGMFHPHLSPDADFVVENIKTATSLRSSQ